jgi:hypothetical protein
VLVLRDVRIKVKRVLPSPSEEVYICMFCGHAGHLDEFCFQHKRMKKRCVDYDRNSYHDEFIDFPRHISSRASSYFSHKPNHRLYDFGSRESGLVPRCSGVDPRSYRSVRPLCRHGFSTRGVYSYLELSSFDGP